MTLETINTPTEKIYALTKNQTLFAEMSNNTDDVVLSVLNYCRKRGFPHYQLTLDEKIKELEKLRKFDIGKIIKDGFVNQTLHAMALCWSYFPHHWGIRTRNMKTPLDVWNDDDLLVKAIKSRIKWGGKVGENGSMTDSNLRKAIRTYSGVQRVSNFRPSAAAAIYQKYCQSGGVVWDMSSGFGGRLVGAIASSKVKKYIGTDPSTPTFVGLSQMAEDFRGLIDIELTQSGSENYIPSEPVDLCFTSPPYFDTEVYSHDLQQSCISYPNIESWNYHFLRKTIQNCKAALKHNGLLILNVANVASHKTLEIDTVSIAEDEGFKLVDTLKMKLSAINFGKTHKHEPIFIFAK